MRQAAYSQSRQPPRLSQHLSQNPLPSAPGQRCTQAFLPASCPRAFVCDPVTQRQPCPRDHIIADEILSINGASPTDRIIAPVKADPAGENLPELLFLPLRQPHVKPRVIIPRGQKTFRLSVTSAASKRRCIWRGAKNLTFTSYSLMASESTFLTRIINLINSFL